MYELDTWKSYPTHYVPLKLGDATYEQLAKLMGRDATVPTSPTNVTTTVLFNNNRNTNDYFQKMINSMATYFLNLTIHYAAVHTEFCRSMTYSASDVNFGIENFAKEYKISHTWIANDGVVNHSCNEDKIIVTWSRDGTVGRISECVDNMEEDDDWSLSSEDDHEMEDFEGCENDTIQVSPEGHWQEVVDEDSSDEENPDFKGKPEPSRSQTQTFNDTFPPLEESEDFFKMPMNEFEGLANEVMELITACYPFGDHSAQILRSAMFRYILDQLRREG